jgi:predicted enzyme related to lactoylglutathione lyase
VGWHELLAADREKAFAFYGELFGWQKADSEVGPTDTYQLFSASGQTIGGMFTKRPVEQVPYRLYYFNIGDIDAAAERVKTGGGLRTSGGDAESLWLEQIRNGPAAAVLEKRARAALPYGSGALGPKPKGGTEYPMRAVRNNHAFAFTEPASSRTTGDEAAAK